MEPSQFFSYMLLVVGALIPIANPFSTAPMFLSLTANFDKAERKRAAKLSCVYMFLLLTTFLVSGVFLLSFFSISLSSLRIAGGLIIGYLGFRMLFPPQTDQQNNQQSFRLAEGQWPNVDHQAALWLPYIRAIPSAVF